MQDGGLEDLLADHLEVATRRAASEPGTEERAALDSELLAVQRKIRVWSDDVHADESERKGA